MNPYLPIDKQDIDDIKSMKTFRCVVNIEKEIEAEDEEQAGEIFWQEIQEQCDSNETLESIVSDALTIEEVKTKSMF